jgi:hypothetical protein
MQGLDTFQEIMVDSVALIAASVALRAMAKRVAGESAAARDAALLARLESHERRLRHQTLRPSPDRE